MRKEFTASVYLINNQKVLLIYHRKLQKWLPPGGHVEADETPVEAARREVMEETGLTIEIISQENLSIDCWNAKSIERPYLCLLEEIPPYGNAPAHQHVDFIFVGRPLEESSSSFSYRWFSWDNLQDLQPDVDIFKETLLVIQHLFQFFNSLQTPLVASL
jgi:8-oxo-dGTP pyrophosphatase MutT (NUDIX family)